MYINTRQNKILANGINGIWFASVSNASTAFHVK